MTLTALQLAGDEAGDAWSRFSALAPGERTALLDELKAEIDRRVRTDPESARPLAEALVRGAREAGDRRALAHRARAVVAYFTGHTAQAAADFEEAARLYLEEGDELGAGRVRRSLVEVLLSLGRSEEALRSAELARASFEAHSEPTLLAQLEVNVGNVYFRLDDYAKAREHYEAARERFEALGDTLGGAFAAFSLGNLETAAYRLSGAARWFASARAAFEEAGQTAQVLDCDLSLAWLDAARGNFDRAVAGLVRLRREYVESKPAGVAYCDLDLATLYQRLDARRDALTHARSAREAFEEMGLEFERARAEAIEGASLLGLGRSEEAHEKLERARADFERLGNAAQRVGLDVQRAFLEEGEEKVVLARLEEALGEAERSGQKLLEGLARLALARARLLAGDARGALATLELDGRDGRDSVLVADAWRLAARAHRTLGDIDAERDALEHAVEAIEGSFAHIPTEGVRIAFLRSRHDAFRELAWLQLEQGDGAGAKRALSLLERSRSRSLARPGSIAGRRPPAEYERARERLDQLLSARLDAELGFGASAEGTGPAPPSAELLAETEQEVVRLARAFERDLGPARFDFEAEGGAASLADDEAALVWLLTPEGARVLVVEAGEVHAVRLELPPGEVPLQRDRLALQLSKARHGREHLARHGARIRRASERALARLGELLLAPALDALRTRPRSLVLVPYGELRGLPFHAMQIAGDPLAARFDVSTTPSLALLARTRRRARALLDTPASLLLTGTDEASLPAVERELGSIERILGPRARRLSADAAHDALRGGGPFRALHVAAHGVFHSEHAAFSGLRLGSRFLTAHDVRRLDLDLDLVVLSGCESGRMQQIEGEESIGLPTAFLASGASSVLSSLWPVEDEATADFMEHLYSQLAQGQSVGNALSITRRAALEREEPLWNWAAFELAGRP